MWLWEILWASKPYSDNIANNAILAAESLLVLYILM
jgi:hypothetical protein